MSNCRTCGEPLYPAEETKGVCKECDKAINLLVSKGQAKRITKWKA